MASLELDFEKILEEEDDDSLLVNYENESSNFNYESSNFNYEELSEIRKSVDELKKSVNELTKIFKNFAKKDAQVNGHIEVIQRLTNERLGDSSMPTVVKKEKKQEKISNVRICKYDDERSKVYGNTYRYKEFIKSAGATWSKNDQVWILFTKNVGELEKILKENEIDYLVDK